MGGVISMNTISKEGANFLASLGSHGSYTGNFSGGTKLKNFNLGLSVNTQRYTNDVVNDLFLLTLPAHLQTMEGRAIDTSVRNRLRASYVKDRLAGY